MALDKKKNVESPVVVFQLESSKFKPGSYKEGNLRLGFRSSCRVMGQVQLASEYFPEFDPTLVLMSCCM
jgi:hypothetical protein